MDDIGLNNYLYLRWLFGIKEDGSAETLKKQLRIFFWSRIVRSTTSETEARSENYHSKENSFKTLARASQHCKERSHQLQLKKEKYMMRLQEQLLERHKRISQLELQLIESETESIDGSEIVSQERSEKFSNWLAKNDNWVESKRGELEDLHKICL
jgi:hypothetical protein